MDVTESQTEWMLDQMIIRTQRVFEDFLEEFTEQGCEKPKYLDVASNMISSRRFTLEVSFLDVNKYNQYLAITIIEDYSKVYTALCLVVANFVFEHTDADGGYQDYFVSFVDVTTRFNIRELSTSSIGQLVRISGHVIKTYPLHPELFSGHFTCQNCQTVVPRVDQKFNYTEPSSCRNPFCTNRRKFILNINKSRYMDVQKIRILECQSELPQGSIPQSLDIILKNENIETVHVGDQYDFTGTLIAVANKSVMSTPSARTESTRQKRSDTDEPAKNMFLFFACSISGTSSRFVGTRIMHSDELPADPIERVKKQMTEPQLEKINEMKCDVNLYRNLINSLFPTIHGNYQIKEGVLLMLFGGVPKTSSERNTIRGDINCCIVGDPSTVKSQLLKQVAEMFPCAVYTSGKATTSLTADVVKDGESSEFVIKPGALVLADNGVCCIDEFDKIDPCNYEAIYEAMEQQTILLEKEGVRATLNARTSILAAANPINDRYDRSKSLRQNVSLSRKIISRFDLFYVLIDKCSEVDNCAITKRIKMHSNMEDKIEILYSQEDILSYISFARQFKPEITVEASEKLVTAYTQLRQYDRQFSRKSYRSITVRHLGSLTRLSEAMAKIKCLDHVTPEHVSEAYSLLKKSIIRVEQPDVNLDDDLLNRMPVPDEMDVDPVDEPENQDFTQIDFPHSFEEYKRITNMLVFYIKSKEKKDIAETSVFKNGGLLRSEIINWYLEKIKHQINDESELVAKKSFIENILDLLINKENALISLSQQQRSSQLDNLNQEQDAEDDDPVLVVHPNFVL